MSRARSDFPCDVCVVLWVMSLVYVSSAADAPEVFSSASWNWTFSWFSRTPARDPALMVDVATIALNPDSDVELFATHLFSDCSDTVPGPSALLIRATITAAASLLFPVYFRISPDPVATAVVRLPVEMPCSSSASICFCSAGIDWLYRVLENARDWSFSPVRFPPPA